MIKPSKTVIFFGNEKLATGLPAAEPVLQNAVQAAGFEIEQIVTGKLSELKPHRSQFAVLAAYGQIIPQSVLDEFPLGIVNVHPSLLPLYRGPTPIEQAILDGVSKTGVSIMKLTAGMDEGPIYKQKTVHLSGHRSKADLTKQLQGVGAELLTETLTEIFEGSLKPRSQPHPNRATYSRKLTKQDALIDWAKPAEQIEREIRAFLGWPGSKTTLTNKEVTITRASVTEISGEPGTVLLQDKKLVVCCGKNSLIIESLKPAGKNEMPATAFVAGHKNLL